MAERIFSVTLFDGQILAPRDIIVRDGVIVNVTEPSGSGIRLEGFVTLGFLDLQVNGGGGILWNAEPTVHGALGIADAHRSFGTVGIMPTLITDAPEVMARAADAMLDLWGEPSILGVHFEGPHINPAKRGTHAARFIRPFDDASLEPIKRLRAKDIPVMLTLAPECVAPRDIAVLTELGVIVSLGHSNATSQEAKAGFAAGARAVTHLYNAMSQMQGREAGLVGAAINSDAFVGIIADGHHVAPEMIALACRARPRADRMFLVSDAMPTVGGPESFDLYDMEIRVEKGRLVNPEGALAGAHISMAEGVAVLVQRAGISLCDALKMAVTHPAQLLGRPDLTTVIGRRADDLICLSPDLGVRGTLGDLLSQVAI